MKFLKHLLMLCLFGMISIGAMAIPNNTIYYTSSDGNVVNPYPYSRNAFGSATIVSNEYSNGQGIIAFDRDVTSIGDYAFYSRLNLTSVTIPNSVTSIGVLAFRDCSGLTSVTVPNSVTWIGDEAFRNCSGLTSVTIPNSVTSIGKWAFRDCSGLTSVTVPNSVTRIESEAFINCLSLKSVCITDLDKWAEIDFKDSNANPLYYAHNLYLNGLLVTKVKLTTTKSGTWVLFNVLIIS